jgi:uncharacterized RmlC-like cupin family protein
MPTENPSPEQMARRIVRFNTIQPKKSRLEGNLGIPAEAFELIAAKSIYLYMAPTNAGGTNQNPGISGPSGLTVNVCRCPPGDGPALHSHGNTIETFMTLRGEFEIRWGDDGQFSTTLSELDMISMPARVMRAFKNTGTNDALLLVLIQGADEHVASDIQYAPETGQRLEDEYGVSVREKIEALGWRFDADLATRSA